MGAPGVLAYWCNSYGTAPANLAALGLPESNNKALRQLRQSAFRREQRLFAKSGFNALGARLISLRARHVPIPLLAGYLNSVGAMLRYALRGHPHLALVGLGSLGYANRSLAAKGHRAAVARIRKWLMSKARSVRRRHNLPAYYQTVLLRWIKEAMGP